MPRPPASAVAVVVVLALVPHALAWNGEAHQLVAWIAEARLSEQAKAGVKELLGDAALSDAEVVSWADQIRRQRRETAPWHYVNIPIDAAGYDPKQHGNAGDNVIDAIERFAKVLADQNAPKEDRVEALKFIVHFVGDLHQPLHCADRNGDKGGNGRLVFFPGRKKAVSLHAVWDTLILPRSKGKQSVAEYGDALNAKITEKQASTWAKGTPQEWALESWHIARDVVYRDIATDGDPPVITEEYIARAQPVVDEQIQKAGMRLAAALNEAFMRAADKDEAANARPARELHQRAGSGEELTADERSDLARTVQERRRRMRPVVAPTTDTAPVHQSTGLIPLTQLEGNYNGMDGGLYGGGRNEPPEALHEAAMAAAGRITPLDATGKPSDEGKVVLLCIGMSNTTHEFSRFKEIADRDELKSPRLVLVDGAQGGQDAADWVSDRRGRIWANVSRRLAAQDVTAEQVQVVWIKQARKGPKRLGEFPAHAQALQRDLANIVAMTKAKYPNLRLAYFSSRTYGGYSAGALNPEPYAYESAFAVRSVINEQKLDDRSPVMLWGPYLWADGTRARDDGLVWDRGDFRDDGTHPSESGRQKVADMLLRFFKSDATAKPWFKKPA